MNRTIVCIAALTAVLLGGAPAGAIPLGNSITVSDGFYGGYHPWHTSSREDNEGEPYVMSANQSWDLEGFFLDGSRLTVVGGYSFRNYLDPIYNSPMPQDRAPGDIFYDFGGDGVYDLVADLDFDALTYSFIALDGSSQFWYPRLVPASSPWRWRSGGTAVAGWQDRPMALYADGLLGAEVGGLMDTWVPGAPDHYRHHSAFAIDLPVLPVDTVVDLHFTMGCGNDMLRGTTIFVPDGGATALMLGAALVGLVLARRRA